MEVARLRKFRKSLKLNQTDFCRPLGILQGSYSDIERGKSSITFKMVKEMIVVYDLNPNWLFLDNGPLTLSELNNQSQPIPEKEKATEPSIDSKEVDLLQKQIKSLEGENDALKKLVAMYEKMNG